jgi:hypothetical protein
MPTTPQNEIIKTYKSKNRRILQLRKQIQNHPRPNSRSAIELSEILTFLHEELDEFYQRFSEELSNHGYIPGVFSTLPINPRWIENVQLFRERERQRRERR